MKRLPITLLTITSLSAFAACQTDTTATSDQGKTQEPDRIDTAVIRVKLKIGSKTFGATLLNNATATALKATLPLTLTMKELNGNEKFAPLPADLPVQATNPGAIQSGELMLYGSNTLVLFYAPLATSYRYTKLGSLNDPSGLAAAVGTGNVTVTLEDQ